MHHDSAARRTENAGVIGRLLRTLAKHIATSLAGRKQNMPKLYRAPDGSRSSFPLCMVSLSPGERAGVRGLGYHSYLCGYHRTLPSVNVHSNAKRYQQHTV